MKAKMGDRVYICKIPSVSIGTAVQDVIALFSTTKGLVLHHLHLDASVSAEAALRMRIKRASATVTTGSGGAAGSPVPVDPADAATATTVRLSDTTQATTSGAFVDMAEFYWDVALPFDHLPSPEDRERCVINGGLFLDLPATITATTISGYVKFSEVP
jgi:hypothetical protein